MRVLAAAFVMGASAWGLPALAACPENALQVALNNYIAVTKPNADPAPIIANIDQIIVACPADPYVLKIAATTYATAKAADVPTAIARLSRAREIFRQMWANLQGNNPPKSVMVDGQPVQIGFDDLHGLEGNVRDLLFNAERIGGVLAAEDQPIGQGAPMRACQSGDSSDAQRAYFWIKDKGDHPGAFNQLDRIIAYCETTLTTWSNTNILSYRARAHIASAKRDLAKPDALDKLKKARADADRFRSIRKQWEIAYWNEAESRELDKLILEVSLKTGALPPKEEWFKPPMLANPQLESVLARTIDDAWAKDAKAGGIGQGHKIFRDEMAKLGGLAFQSPDRAKARTVLYTAAKAHAEGSNRAPENRGLKAPPEFLYRWIDPTYTPPPTPAPATPQ